MLLVGILSIPLLVIPNVDQLLSVDPRTWLALSLLAILPFLGAIGTSNPLFVNTVFHHSTWYLLIGMMLLGWGKALGSDPLGELLLIILAAHGVKQTVYAMIHQPYRLVGPLTAQTESIEVGSPATSIKMSPAAANFIGLFRQMLEANGFKPGDDIIALFDMPGLVYAVGGRSPGHQWYYTVVDRNEAMMEANAWNLRRVATERLQRSFIVQKGDISCFHNHLSSLHLSFPDEYALCGQLVSPFSHEVVTLWKPLIAVKQDDACSRYRHITLANRALGAGKPEVALYHMQTAVGEQPHNVELRVDTGNLLLNQGQPAQAREHFEAALGVSEHDAAASLGLAVALVQTDTFAGVRPLLDTVLATDSQNVLALKILGWVARREGLAAEAQKHFQKALLAQPNDQESLEQLIILETEHGNTPTAQELFERLSDLNPQNANLSALRNALMSRCETTAT
jgi:tetratricopeptide (TPR) repeat protein